MKNNFEPVIAEWLSFVRSPKYNLIEKCLKLAQLLEYPQLEISNYVQKINEIGRSLSLSISEVNNPTYRISILNECLFLCHVFPLENLAP